MNLGMLSSRIAAYVAAFLIPVSATLAAPVARCPFDNELVSAQREGMIYARYALGIRNAPLLAATGFAPEHAAAAQAAMECPSCWPQLDIIGSAGIGHTAAVMPLKPDSELFNALTYGVLKLTLDTSAYSWEFLPELVGVVVDSGSAACNRLEA